MIRQVIGAALLTLLVAVLGWINLSQQTERLHPVTSRIDQRFVDFNATDFTRQGQPAWQMQGKRLDHLRPARGYRMVDPTFRYHDPQHPGPAWQLRAPQGTADNDLTRIELSGGVVGHRPAFGTQGQLDLSTARLDIRPKKHQAETTADARFSETRNDQTRWTSHSKGFALDYNQRKLQQFRVTDHYLTPTAP